MTLAQAKRLKVGESFSRPSSNSHDAHGKRIYTVVTAHPNFHTVDQHGYHTGAGAIEDADRSWFKPCEKIAAIKINPQFPVGSAVCHRAFKDCFGKQHDAVTGLTVIESNLIEPGSTFEVGNDG